MRLPVKPMARENQLDGLNRRPVTLTILSRNNALAMGSAPALGGVGRALAATSVHVNPCPVWCVHPRACSARGREYVFTVSPPLVGQTCSLLVSPGIVAARDDFLTTDGHGLTRMKTRLSLIRVHPWLDHFGCGLAALGRIAGL